MKKIVFGAVVTMFTLSSLQSTAQMKKGAYASLNVGYNAGAAVGSVSGIENRTSTTTTSTTEAIKFSYGKGITAGLNLGYMVNENIGFELGLGYLVGGKTKATNQQTFGSTTGTTVSTTSATAIQIKPTVVLAATINKMSPYAKFGLVIGSTTIKNFDDFKSGTNTGTERSTTKGGMAIGFNSAIGVAFPINANLSILAELNMVNMQYSPKKNSVTEYTINGVDKLGTLSVANKEIEYVKSVSSVSTPSTSPSQVLSTPLAFGSIGINVGVKYSF
jgi:outer membrane protein W